jgi:hypothetical protein
VSGGLSGPSELRKAGFIDRILEFNEKRLPAVATTGFPDFSSLHETVASTHLVFSCVSQ